MLSLTKQFEQAQNGLEHKLRLVALIARLPTSQRRALVFEALLIAEGAHGSTSSSSGRAAPSTPTTAGLKLGGRGRRKRGGRGTYDQIVELLRATPEMPVPKIGKLVYGDDKWSTQKVHTALNTMKGKRVARVDGKRGAWRVIEAKA